MEYKELSQKYPEFIYESLDLANKDEGLAVSFSFRLGEFEFKPALFIPKFDLQKTNLASLEKIFLSLGMLEALSYWKASCAPVFKINAGALSKEEKAWWHNFYLSSLGEFYYKNQINFLDKDFLRFETLSEKEIFAIPLARSSNERNLVLLGGGKDSVVSMKLLEKANLDYALFSLAPTQAAKDCAKVSGKELIVFNRKIDPLLLSLNAQGFLNGHTPISAYYAFSAVIAGVIFGYKNIIVSNESSANEGNISYLGREINHQYSKSFAMEQDLRGYFMKFICPEINYYSLLRPLNELQISALFSKAQKYHEVFRSCNKGSKENIWCGVCSKCVFVYVMLFPFLLEKTREIFSKDLFEDVQLLEVFKELLQLSGKIKPFECVGTREEVLLSLFLAREYFLKKNLSLPVILTELEKEQVFQNFEVSSQKQNIISQWNPHNFLDKSLDNILRKELDEL